MKNRTLAITFREKMAEDANAGACIMLQSGLAAGSPCLELEYMKLAQGRSEASALPLPTLIADIRGEAKSDKASNNGLCTALAERSDNCHLQVFVVACREDR